MGYRMLGMPWGILGAPIGSKLGSSKSGGAAPGFLPTDVAGLLLWVRSDVGVYQEHVGPVTPSGNGDPVGTWQDQSGNGYDITALAGGTTYPTYITNALNGLPAVRFDGIDDGLRRLPVAVAQPHTLYIVFKQIGHAVGRRIFGDGTGASILYQAGSSPRMYLYAGSADPFLDTHVINTYGVIRAVWNGVSSTLRLNAGVDSVGNCGANNKTVISLGCDQIGGQPSNIEVAELVYYNSAISGNDDTNIMNYLNNRYAIY